MKLVFSIINNPFEEKFKSIKKTNATLREKLFISPIIDSVLACLGFASSAEGFVFPGSNPLDLINALPVIRDFMEDITISNLPAEEQAKKYELKVFIFSNPTPILN